MAKYEQNIIIRERSRLLFLGLPFTFKVYTLTDKQLCYKQGFLNTIEEEIQLYRVIDITKKRNIIQRILGLGTIIVYSNDRTDSQLEIKNIAHYDDFYHYLSESVESERIRYRVRPGEVIDGTPGPSDYVPMH